MAKKADTWMPWYVADYLADTSHLNTEQHGAYCLMLMAAWKRGGYLPHDESQLTSICRLSPAKWKSHRSVLLGFFEDTSTSYAHKRVLSEYMKANDLSEKKAIAGAGGAAKRWGSHAKSDGIPIADAIADPLANASQTDAPARVFLPSPLPSQIPKEKYSGGAADADTTAKTISIKALIAEGVDKQKAADWLVLRKAKRLPLTVSAWDDTKAEGEKVGLTPAQTVGHAVCSNWAGFKASWYTKDHGHAAPVGAQQSETFV